MIRQPPRSTRTDTLFPYTTLFRSLAGGVLLPLNIRLAPAELRAILAASGAVVLFRHPDEPDPGQPGQAIRTVVLGDEHEELLAAQPSGPVPPPPVDARAPAEVFYPSGSPGTPDRKTVGSGTSGSVR